MGLDGALGEDVSLALQLLFLVQFLQRTQQVVGAVVLKCQRIGATVDKAVFCGKAVIERVQFCLSPPDCAVRGQCRRGADESLCHFFFPRRRCRPDTHRAERHGQHGRGL